MIQESTAKVNKTYITTGTWLSAPRQSFEDSEFKLKLWSINKTPRIIKRRKIDSDQIQRLVIIHADS